MSSNPLVPIAPAAWNEFCSVARTGRIDLEIRFNAACREIERLRGRLAELAGQDPNDLQTEVVNRSIREQALRNDAPEWMNEQVDVFYERVELMILAFVAKHGQRPTLFLEDQRTVGQMVAFLHPRFVADDGEPTHPKLAELATRKAPEWKERFPAIEPDECLVYMTAEPENVRVTVCERTEETLADLAQRASAIAGFLEQARRGMH